MRPPTACPRLRLQVIFPVESHAHFAAQGNGRDDGTAIPAYCTHDAAGVRRTRHLYGRQCGVADGFQIIFGGDRLAASPTDYAVPDESVTSLRCHLRELAPRLELAVTGGSGGDAEEGGGGATGAWAGLMPFSEDGKALVGECDALGFEQLWLACGFGPKGIMEGPMAGRLLA